MITEVVDPPSDLGLFKDIIFKPDESVTFLPIKDRQVRELLVQNETSDAVMFKMRLTDAEKYRCNPVSFLVEPKQKKTVELVFKGMENDGTPPKKDDHFSILMALAPSTKEDVEAMWEIHRKNKGQLIRKHIIVQFEEPQKKMTQPRSSIKRPMSTMSTLSKPRPKHTEADKRRLEKALQNDMKEGDENQWVVFYNVPRNEHNDKSTLIFTDISPNTTDAEMQAMLQAKLYPQGMEMTRISKPKATSGQNTKPREQKTRPRTAKERAENPVSSEREKDFRNYLTKKGYDEKEQDVMVKMLRHDLMMRRLKKKAARLRKAKEEKKNEKKKEEGSNPEILPAEEKKTRIFFPKKRHHRRRNMMRTRRIRKKKSLCAIS